MPEIALRHVMTGSRRPRHDEAKRPCGAILQTGLRTPDALLTALLKESDVEAVEFGKAHRT